LVTGNVVKWGAVIFLGPSEHVPRSALPELYAEYAPGTWRNTNYQSQLLRPWRFRVIARNLLAMGPGALAGGLARWWWKRERVGVLQASDATNAAEGASRDSRSSTPTSHRCIFVPWFSLRWLFAATSVTAFATGALWRGSDGWASASLTATLAALSVATLRAATRGRKAPFSLGFALVGWPYLAISVLAFVNQPALCLPTERITAFALGKSLGLPPATLTAANVARGSAPSYQPGSPSWRYLVNVHRIALSLWSVGLGCVGGLATAALVARDDARQPSAALPKRQI
jgi:hypothetical protein